MRGRVGNSGAGIGNAVGLSSRGITASFWVAYMGSSGVPCGPVSLPPRDNVSCDGEPCACLYNTCDARDRRGGNGSQFTGTVAFPSMRIRTNGGTGVLRLDHGGNPWVGWPPC